LADAAHIGVSEKRGKVNSGTVWAAGKRAKRYEKEMAKDSQAFRCGRKKSG